ncbi:MAG: hypothetical protein JXB35_17915, partial [Anaerolineae bacterium]|nr:hypothetical protein [Anaerolineae bacterium]
SGWRGVLRHIQTREQIHFTRLDEALAFIARFVPLEPDMMQDNQPDDMPQPDHGVLGTEPTHR